MVITSSPTVLSIELGIVGIVLIRAYVRQQLTLGGILAASLTGLVHAIHPWTVFSVLLLTFFVAGTAVTKVNHARKATLTTSPAGNVANTPHPRTATQVICNSAPASIAVFLHWLYIDTKLSMAPGFLTYAGTSVCLPHPRPTPTSIGPPSLVNVLPYAVFAHYAVVAADTFASELGILSRSSPILVTAPWRRVPRGTNGGITLAGVLASALGAGVIGAAALFVTPFCKGRSLEQEELRTAYLHGYTLEGTEGGQRRWSFSETLALVGLVVAIGVFGGLLDSVLGALFQASVVDAHTGKIVEGEGGVKVHYSSAYPGGTKVKVEGDGKGGRRLIVGRDVLSNNGVNLAMSVITGLVAMAAAAAYMGLTPTSLGQDVKGLYDFGVFYLSAKNA